MMSGDIAIAGKQSCDQLLWSITSGIFYTCSRSKENMDITSEKVNLATSYDNMVIV